jgi:UDP-glucose:tetrahydrobiopterin glucosyltransferase
MTHQRVSQPAAPLRIAVIAPLVSPIAEPQIGGSQVVVSDLARGLVARGHDVTIYAAEGSRVEGVAVTTLGIDADAFGADTFRHDGQATASRALVEAYATVYAHVRGRRFDVVHNHGYDAPAITEALRAEIPVLHTLHLPPAGAIIDAVTEARTSRIPAWFFGVSSSHAAAWQLHVPDVGILANGVPVDSIPYAHVAPRTAVIASRFSCEKGMAEGIAAARQAEWPVTVYGTPYDADYEAAVRARWSDDPGVRFFAAVERESLWRALAGAGVVLALVRWDEPFGMVVAEAQAAGTPVVATRRGALAAIIRDGETGALVETDDIGAAVTALGTADTLDRAACRRHAFEHLNLPASIARHEALYARIAALTRTTV